MFKNLSQRLSREHARESFAKIFMALVRNSLRALPRRLSIGLCKEEFEKVSRRASVCKPYQLVGFVGPCSNFVAFYIKLSWFSWTVLQTQSE